MFDFRVETTNEAIKSGFRDQTLRSISKNGECWVEFSDNVGLGLFE